MILQSMHKCLHLTGRVKNKRKHLNAVTQLSTRCSACTLEKEKIVQELHGWLVPLSLSLQHNHKHVPSPVLVLA